VNTLFPGDDRQALTTDRNLMTPTTESPVLTETEFKQRLAATAMPPAGKSARACRLVLVEGLTAYGAAQRIGIAESAVSRALARLRSVEPVTHCPLCGQVID
jgi:hypothetical protein